MEFHYCFGSGSPGCLYDFGPNFCETIEQAVESFKWLFSELEDSELAVMEEDLRLYGIHYFPADTRERAGASYCQISKQAGPIPENDE